LNNEQEERVVAYFKIVLYSFPGETEEKHRTASAEIFVPKKKQLFQLYPLYRGVQSSNLRPVRTVA
jgi:hypothetical protein